MRYLRKLRLLVAAAFAVNVFVFAEAPPAQAALFDSAKEDACKGATFGSSGSCTQNADDTLTKTIGKIINLFSVIIGIVAVVVIMIAGFRYITSAGDANGISAAKNTLIYAIVGLIIAALAQVIVRFVLSKT